MSGNKINPLFIILCGAGVLIVLFALFLTILAGANLDEPDANKGEVSLQLATMLNFIIAGLALILAGVGFQLTAGAKAGQVASPAAYPQPGYGIPQPQQPHAQPWGQQPPPQSS